MTFDVLFVCTANQGRSPLAMALFRKHLEERGLEDHVRVRSAGRMEGGVPISPEVADAAARLDTDLEGHRSNQLDTPTVERADLILGMTPDHLVQVDRLSTLASERTHLLARFVRAALDVTRGDDEPLEAYVRRVAHHAHELGATAPDEEIEDPYGQPIEALHDTAARLERLTGELVDRLWPSEQPPASVGP